MTDAMKYLALANDTHELALKHAATLRRLEKSTMKDDFVQAMVLHRARSVLLELNALEQELRFAAQNAGAC